MQRRQVFSAAATALAGVTIARTASAARGEAQARTGLHHIGLFVPDVDAAISFYSNALGFKLKYRWPGADGDHESEKFRFGIAGAFLDTGDGNYIEIFPSGDGALEKPDMPLNHFALRVADCEAAYSKALAHGAKPHTFQFPDKEWDGSPMEITTDGDDSATFFIAFVRGPAGELIEFFQNDRF